MGLKTVGLIPARLESSRLPNKALLDILSYPMIVHVAKRAMLCDSLDSIAVCTDSKDIAEVCLENGIDIVLTRSDNKNGTERIAEAASILDLGDDDIVIDIQGDEPLLLPEMVDSVIRHMCSTEYDIVVPYLRLVEEDSPNKVKVIESGGRVLYLTRAHSPYPFLRESTLKKHLSIIGFKKSSLDAFYFSAQTELELIEGVELLRALEIGLSIGTYEENGETLAVDTKADYERVIRLMGRDKLYGTY